MFKNALNDQFLVLWEMIDFQIELRRTVIQSPTDVFLAQQFSMAINDFLFID